MLGEGTPDAVAVKDAVEPAATEYPLGWDVTTGAILAAVTVSVAACVVTLPAEFLKVAWNSSPVSPWVATKEYTDAFAPGTVVHVLPFDERRQDTLAAGVADAVALKVAVEPALTTSAVGCCVISGASMTRSFADFVVTDPATFLKTASKLYPFLFRAAMTV
jgi:hypothetical protein